MLEPTPEREEDYAAQLVDRLPRSIRVGAFDIRITKMTVGSAGERKEFGSWATAEQTIRIQRAMPSRHKVVDTFWHEVSHALFYVYGIETKDREERVVGVLGTAMMALFRDNPWLIDWIKSVKL